VAKGQKSEFLVHNSDICLKLVMKGFFMNMRAFLIVLSLSFCNSAQGVNIPLIAAAGTGFFATPVAVCCIDNQNRSASKFLGSVLFAGIASGCTVGWFSSTLLVKKFAYPRCNNISILASASVASVASMGFLWLLASKSKKI